MSSKAIEVVQHNVDLFLEQLDVGVTDTIVVMIRMVWDVNAVTRQYLSIDFVVCDARGVVYSIKNFILQPNKDDYRIIRHDPLMLEFDGSTTTRKVSVKSGVFVKYPFELADFDDIKPTNIKYLIDVAGLLYTFHRADKLYLSSSSSTLIYDNPDIPALIELKVEMSSVELNKAIVPVDFSEPKDGTLMNLLIWGRNKKNNSMIYNYKVKIDNVRTRKGWNYPSCGDNKCKKGTTQKEGRFWCDACDKPVEYPVLRFRLDLDVSDETAQTVVVLFDETMRDLLKCSPESLLEDDTEAPDGGSNLPRAISDLIGAYHIFEVKSHTYFEHGTFESFTSWKIIPAPPAGESAGSSNLEASDGSASSLMKRFSKERLSMNPSVSTLLKPVEGKNKIRMEYEAVDTELQDSDQTGRGDGSALEKKTRRVHCERLIRKRRPAHQK
ncbi:hypothetical protein OROHE_007823 [Orobanche hederae]